jgi:transcriptional regulator with XRE-family HTH domain
MTNTYTEKVIGELRAEIARQRLTQREVAARLGWSQQVLSKRLTGEVAISIDEAGKLAEVLGIKPEQLMQVQR